MMPPKCYTWLESCGSQLSDGKNEKLFFCILQSVGFSMTLRTDIFLYTEKLSYPNIHTELPPNLSASWLRTCWCSRYMAEQFWLQCTRYTTNPTLIRVNKFTEIAFQNWTTWLCPKNTITLCYNVVTGRNVMWYERHLGWFCPTKDVYSLSHSLSSFDQLQSDQ